MLEWSQVGDVGVVEVAKSMEEGHLAELEEMNFESNKISGVGLQALVRAVTKGALPKLRKLDLSNNEVGHAWGPMGSHGFVW